MALTSLGLLCPRRLTTLDLEFLQLVINHCLPPDQGTFQFKFPPLGRGNPLDLVEGSKTPSRARGWPVRGAPSS